MSLSERISGVEGHRKTVTVFNTDGSVVAAFRDLWTDDASTVDWLVDYLESTYWGPEQ